MGSFILCQTQKAEHPFYVENIAVNIYSMEELCYFLYHNLYLIDRTIINEELCAWIGDELKLAQLAAKLKLKVGKFASAEDFLYPIFKEINYLTYEELKELNRRLKKMDEETVLERQKKKGDSLVENGMYVSAIRVYQKLLAQERTEQEPVGFTASVYHNLGCAYSYLFQMEKAVECFEKAYLAAPNSESMKTYLLAYRSVRTPIEYESRLEELSADEEIRQAVARELERFSRIPEPPVYSQHIDELLETFTSQYQRSAAGGKIALDMEKWV